ncbi:MAG: hypothetical protein HFG15_02190 [Bacilli bacterium]|nr:hypothetical protein [Bacilli bacterium]
MNFFKKNKKLTMWVGMILGILLVLFLIKILIFPAFGSNAYGNRLDGISKVRIHDDSITKLKQSLVENTKVNAVTYDLKGRIINFIIDVKEGVSVEDAKKIADGTLSSFTEEQKEYYDIQIILTQDTVKDTSYPYIGYKHKTSKGLFWTNN